MISQYRNLLYDLLIRTRRNKFASIKFGILFLQISLGM